MRSQAFSIAVLPLCLWTLVSARLHHSLVPEDPHAFPKYRVAFLNGLPLLNETAHRWIQSGLRGGELEFLDQPWEEDSQWRTQPVKSIEGSSQVQEQQPDSVASSEVSPLFCELDVAYLLTLDLCMRSLILPRATGLSS